MDQHEDDTPMMDEDGVEVYTLYRIHLLTGIPHSTLQAWEKKGILEDALYISKAYKWRRYRLEDIRKVTAWRKAVTK